VTNPIREIDLDSGTSPRAGDHKAASSPDPRLTRVIVLGLAAYYGLTAGGHHYSIDGILMFETAKQLLFHGTLVLDPPVVWGNATLRMSRYGLGLSLAYLPALALLAPFAEWIPHLTTVPYEASNPFNQALYQSRPYMFSSWVNPFTAAVTAALAFRLARSLALSRGWSLAAALAYGLASPAAAYARYDFAQPLAGLALTAALLFGQAMPTARRLVGVGVSLGAAILIRPDFVVLAGWLVGGVAVRARRISRAVLVVTPVFAGVAVTLAINQMKYGVATATGYSSFGTLFTGRPLDVLLGVLGLLVGPSHGLLIFFPLSSLAFLGVARMLRSRGRSASLWAGLLALTVVFWGAYSVWWGGWNWGPRFLLPLIPLLSVTAAYWAATPGLVTRAARRALFWTLVGIGVLISWNGILMDFVVFHIWLLQRGILPADARGQFQIFVSPLVSGWELLAQTSPDLLWLRAWGLGGSATLTSAISVPVLVGVAIWSAVHMRSLLRQD
jgi:hypothetical protein